MRAVLPSLKTVKFKYTGGEEFEGELWLLNDSPEKVETIVEVYLEIDGKEKHIITWNTGESEENSNIKGHTVRFNIPETLDGEFRVIMKSNVGDSVYRFISNKKEKQIYTNSLNA